MHRAAVIFQKYGSSKITHGQFVSAVYQIISTGDTELAEKLHRPQKFKPFTFAIDESEKQLTLYFSSIDPSITDTFVSGIEILKGTGLMMGDCLCKIVECIEIADISYFPSKIKLRTISPITVSRCENGKKRSIPYNNVQDWTNALKKNLAKRISTYLCKDNVNIEIKPVNHGKLTFIEYQGTNIPARHLLLELAGDKEALKAAIYNGLGERTGSGFGMVLPC
jgi:CRISPR-associated endoribonuclease Cas6